MDYAGSVVPYYGQAKQAYQIAKRGYGVAKKIYSKIPSRTSKKYSHSMGRKGKAPTGITTSMPKYGRRKYRRRAGRAKGRRKGARKGTERKMRGGGNKLRLKTMIVPRESIVKLPYSRTFNVTKTATTSAKSFCFASLRNSLYWPFKQGARLDEAVRGTDFWAGGYRGYEVLGIKIKAYWIRNITEGSQVNRVYPWIHAGAEDRSDLESTQHCDDIRHQKNTKMGRILFRADATTNDFKKPCFMSKYISRKYIGRDQIDPSSFTAKLGLPASAGANNTDPTFGFFLNFGISCDEVETFLNTSQTYGQLRLTAVYYVRIFDRKYYKTDENASADAGGAAQQTLWTGAQ